MLNSRLQTAACSFLKYLNRQVSCIKGTFRRGNCLLQALLSDGLFRSDEGLTRETLYGGQLTLSQAQLS